MHWATQALGAAHEALETSVGLAGGGGGEAGGTAAAVATASRALLQQNTAGNATTDTSAIAALDEQLTQLCECKGGGGRAARVQTRLLTVRR